MFAQLPQLITNYHRQSAEALSAFFLAQWLLGDTCNLLGALLKGDQPETVILTAQYFICMDVVLLLQYLYYTAVARRLERTYVLTARRHHHYRHHGHHHGHHSNRHHSSRHHHHQHSENRGDGLTSNDAGEVEATQEALSNEIESRVDAGSDTLLQSTNESTHSNNNNSSINHARPKALAAAAAGATTIACSLAGFLFFQNYSSFSFSIAPSLMLALKEWQQSTGSILGYISCILYLASRVSQILKNSQRQSAEGLASSMFLCAVAANLFYGTSVLMRSRTKEEIVSSLPWVLGSLGTVALDGVILTQTVLFAKEEGKNNAAAGGHGISTAAAVDRSDIEQPLLEESAEHGVS
jgi:solute carrier family 66 (lysosomal lysine-arginine transporter), member 1